MMTFSLKRCVSPWATTGGATTVPLSPAASRESQVGAVLALMTSSMYLKCSLLRPRSLKVIVSPSLTWAEGMSSLWPFTADHAVADDLAGLVAGFAEAETVDDVVEPRFEDADEVFAGNAGAADGFLVVADELAFRGRRS